MIPETDLNSAIDLADRDDRVASASPGNQLFEPGRNCCDVARADRAALIVDGEHYFAAFKAAAERAEHAIILLAWDFDSRTPLSFDGPDHNPTPIGEFLNDLVERRKQLHVHILDWDFPMVFGTDREFPPIFGLSWKPHRRVHFRYDDTHPLAGCHHQKIAVFDDRCAFVGGLDITSRRWDTRAHRPGDPRRVFQDAPYPPFHDLMLAVDGQAAQAVAKLARARWKRAVGAEAARVPVATDPWPQWLEPSFIDVSVAIACTAPPVNGDAGVRDIEALYLDMIAAARRSIYIENQYFTAPRIADALAARLAEPDGPEIVLVSRLLSHGWLEEMTMHTLRARLIRKLREADRYERFEAYFPHVDGLADGTCIDMHSKMMLVDDEWLRIGSANLSNRSMGVDSECDLAIEARGDPDKHAAIRAIRDELLAEHLDTTADDVASHIARTGSMRGAIAALAISSRALHRLAHDIDVPAAAIDVAAIADPERPISLEQMIDQFAHENGVPSSHSLAVKIALPAAAVVALGLVWHYTLLGGLTDRQSIAAWVAELAGNGLLAPLLMLAYTPASMVIFPRPLITLALVVVFGAVPGFAYAISGILLAALATYAIGRRLSRQTVRRLARRKLNRVSRALRKRGLLAVTALRLVPVAPFALESVVAGALRVKLRYFLPGTALGTLPGVFFAAVLGSEIRLLLRDPSASFDYWLLGWTLVFVLGITLLVRKWLQRLIGEPRGKQRAEASGTPAQTSQRVHC